MFYNLYKLVSACLCQILVYRIASKLEKLLDNTILRLKKRDKLLLCLLLKRLERLTNFFLPSLLTLLEVQGLMPRVLLLSLKLLSSLLGFILTHLPLAALAQQQYLANLLTSKADKIALLELKNVKLQQQNKVFYKQNLDYRNLV